MLAKLKLGSQDLKKIEINGNFEKEINYGDYEVWNRDSTWLTMPTFGASEQKVAILAFILDDGSNFVTLRFAGNYTVDWGDGTIQNFTANTNAQYSYDYSSIPNSTLTTYKGFVVKQVIIQITPQSSQNLTLLNFTLKHTSFPVSKSGWSVPFAEVIISMPFLVSSANFTFNASVLGFPFLEKISVINHGLGTWTNTTQNLENLRHIDINCGPMHTFNSAFSGCDSLISINLYNASNVSSMTSSFRDCASLQRVALPSMPSLTNLTQAFYGCYSLREFTITQCATNVNLDSFVYFCYRIKNISFGNAVQPTNINFAFYNCNSLKFLPNIDFSQVTTANSAFQNCSSLREVNLSIPACTSCSSLLAGCTALEKVVLNAPATTSLASAFSGNGSLVDASITTSTSLLDVNNCFLNCFRLEQAPFFITSAATNISSMFNGCYSLKILPAYNFSSATNVANTFNLCSSLKTIGSISFPAATSLASTFASCSSLEEVTLNVPSCSNFSSTFSACGNLKSITLTTNVSGTSTWTSTFASCPILTRVSITAPSTTSSIGSVGASARSIRIALANNITRSISFTGCSLSRQSIVNLFTSLGTAAGGQTVTVTNNPGSSSLTAADILIATSKGWAVSS